MAISASDVSVPIGHTDRFFIGGEWVNPSSDSTITVIDSHTEKAYDPEVQMGPLGLMLFLEPKAILLDGPTSRYADVEL